VTLFHHVDVNLPVLSLGGAFVMLQCHSFIQAISIAPLQPTTTQRRSRHNTDTVLEFHAEAPQTTASEELAEGPYVAAGAGFEPSTLQTNA